MSIFKKIALVLLCLVVLFVAVGLLLPRQCHVERATTIDAPQATVFAVLNGFKSFNKWSPWFELDPNAKYTWEGPDFGVGAKTTWASEKKEVGSGSQEIVESHHPDRVKVKLDFGNEGVALATYTLSPEGSGTRVVWGFDTDLGMNPVSRYFGLMFHGMLGSDFEKGLAGLKKLSESLPKTDFADLKVESVTVEPITVAYIPASSTKDNEAIAAAIGGAYAQVGKFMGSHRLSQSGAPITINTKWDESGYEFEAAIPVDKAPEGDLPADSAVKVKQTYAGKALKVVHTGPYDGLSMTYDKLHAFVVAHGYEMNGSPWDQYVSDPGNTPEAELITHIYMPVM